MGQESYDKHNERGGEERKEKDRNGEGKKIILCDRRSDQMVTLRVATGQKHHGINKLVEHVELVGDHVGMVVVELVVGWCRWLQ